MKRSHAFLLDYAAYDSEPLHLLISAALSGKAIGNAQEIVEPLIELFRNGYIEAYHHSGFSGDPYESLDELKKDNLFYYIERNINNGFTSYPEKGGEFFFRTTDKGFELLKLAQRETDAKELETPK